MTLVTDSLDVHWSALRAAHGVTGRYVRGDTEVELVGVPDKLSLAERGIDLEAVSSKEQDWLFPAERLVINGLQTLPQRGDKWITPAETYEIHHRGEPEPYRILPGAKMIRAYSVLTDE